MNLNFDWRNVTDESLEAFERSMVEMCDEIEVQMPCIDHTCNISYVRDNRGKVAITCSSVVSPMPGIATRDITGSPALILDEYCKMQMGQLSFEKPRYEDHLNGIRVIDTEISVIALPLRSDVDLAEVGTINTPLGSLPYVVYRHELPANLMIVPLSANREDLHFLGRLYFIGPKDLFGQHASSYGEELYYKPITVAVRDLTVTGDEVHVGFSVEQLGGSFMIPEGLYTTGHAFGPGQLRIRMGDKDLVTAGDYNAGDLYLLDVFGGQFTVVAVKYPGISMEVSTNMYRTYRRRKIAFKSGKDRLIEFRDGSFVIQEDSTNHGSVPLVMPSMYGHPIFTQSFVDGTLDVVYAKGNFNPKLAKWGLDSALVHLVTQSQKMGLTCEHFVPCQGGMVAASRVLFMPFNYLVSSYVGGRTMRSRALNMMLQIGKLDKDRITRLGYTKQEIERLVHSMRKRDGIELPKVETVDEMLHRLKNEVSPFSLVRDVIRRSPNLMLDDITRLLVKHNNVFIIDIIRIINEHMNIVMPVLKNMLMRGRVVVDVRNGSIQLTEVSRKELMERERNEAFVVGVLN